MRVLLVITGLSMGGAENVVVNLADELVKRGHTVKIVYLTGAVLVLPINPDIEVLPIGMTGYKSFLSAIFKLRKIIKKFNPDVVHSHMVHANILCRLVRLTVYIPKLISTAHNKNEGGKLRMLAYRITDKLADISTNVSEEAVSEFILKGAVKSGRMVAVPNGIDTDKFIFNPAIRENIRKELGAGEENVLLAVGRLMPEKDYPTLLKALFLLTGRRKDFKLFIVGDGPLRFELIDYTEKLGLSDHVQFLGIRRDVSSLMSATDLFILSSAWEGFGLVVAEAMACKRVVIATDCGGVKEVLSNTGFLVPISDPNTLAKAIDNALNMTSSERMQLGTKARDRILKEYSLIKNVDAYLDLYIR